ncbi:hypothetical protein Tco_1113746 [Tanacetum coccineum]|uniref:Uncharacterized protein n=1 Tax=Tanacetum coccineum TaxID=301880 RepID=A0ABQ5IW24_9ASTR
MMLRMIALYLEPESTASLYRDRPFHRALPFDEGGWPDYLCAWATDDGCLQIRYILRAYTTEGCTFHGSAVRDSELPGKRPWRQSGDFRSAERDYRDRGQLWRHLKIVKSLQDSVMIGVQRQQGPAKDHAEPELPERRPSSSS